MVLNEFNISDKYLRHLSSSPMTSNGYLSREIYLTFGHQCKNMRYTNCRYRVLSRTPNPESFKSFSQPLCPWRDRNFFRRWGHLTWPGDLTLNDMDLIFSGKLRNSCSKSYAKNLRGCKKLKILRGVFKQPPPLGESYGQGQVKSQKSMFQLFASETGLSIATRPNFP